MALTWGTVGLMTKAGTKQASAAYDAVVVGSGPNGLAAAMTLAEAGLKVIVFEARDSAGGGMRTKELTLPGFHHDVCSAVHPMALASPFFRRLPLARYGLEWIHAPYCLAHPVGDGAAVLARSLAETVERFGVDGKTYKNLLAPLVPRADELTAALLGPLLRLPRQPFLAARFGLTALRSAQGVAKRFQSLEVQALWSGLSAHTTMPLSRLSGAAVPLMMAVAAHAYGWPVAKTGSGALAAALVEHAKALGVEFQLGSEIRSLAALPAAKVVLLDLSPAQVLDFADLQLKPSYRERLQRFRYGPGIFKLDWALSGPIPWRSALCRQAATVHVGGPMAPLAAYEEMVFHGDLDEAATPFVLLAQPSLFDPTRAPPGQHTAWAYCHVPHGAKTSMTAAIEDRIEAFAPGFKALILKRHSLSPAQLQAYNANYIGGTISGGVADLPQLFARPAALYDPYRLRTAGPPTYICSASTPPGGGVHGLCGFYAAQAVLRR